MRCCVNLYVRHADYYSTAKSQGATMPCCSNISKEAMNNSNELRIELPARPEAVTLAPARTAVIVVDLQNGYASKGGYRDLRGRDISGADSVVQNTNRILKAARAAGCTIVLLQNGWEQGQRDAGGPSSPNWHKSNPLKLMRERPELRDKILTKGSWDFALVDSLSVEPGDLIVPKARYSGFAGTNLDLLLRERDIRTLIVTGIASNVCVESTIRDALFREYFCVLVHDATQQSGPPYVQQAVIYNVETFLGWVSDTASVCAALQPELRLGNTNQPASGTAA
jgi:ureidoacrylate peracid hydrolase